MKTTHQGFSIAFVCGSPGSGKSYCMTRDVIERLASGFEGKIFTNLPLEVEKIAHHVASKTGRDAADIAAQIQLLEKATLSRWADGHGGPWELSLEGKADGNELILDECHRFCRRKGPGVQGRNVLWTGWLGEVRHEGWRRLVFVTQDESKVGEPITTHAELYYELTNSERRRDPILRIPLHYWYELIASFTREYRSSVAAVEFRRVKGKLREQHVDRYSLDPFWFQFYRSYEAAGGGTGSGPGGTEVRREYKVRPIAWFSKVDGKRVAPTWAWFLSVHWWRFAIAGSIAGFGIWVTILGGMNTLLTMWMSRMGAIAGANRTPGASGSKPSARTEGEPEQALPSPARRQSEERIARPSPAELADILSRVPEADRAKLLAEFQGFADSFQRERSRSHALLDARASERKLMRVVAVTNDTAWFTDPPCSCKVGRVLDEGPYAGRRLERLNVDDGWAELAGGVRLWVGRGVDPGLPAADANGLAPDNATGGESSGEVSRPVQSVGPAGNANQNRSAGASDNDIGAGDGLRSVLSGSGSPSGSVDRGRGRAGNPASNSGDTRPTDIGRPSVDRSTDGS